MRRGAPGYGIQGRSLLPRLKQLDVVDELAVFAWFRVARRRHNGEWVPGPSGWTRPTETTCTGQLFFRADILITLIDAWVIKAAHVVEDIKTGAVAALPATAWIMTSAGHLTTAIKDAYMPISYAKFGNAKLDRAGLPDVYIPPVCGQGIFRSDRRRDGGRVPARSAKARRGWA